MNSSFHIQSIVISDGKNTTVTIENSGVVLNVNIHVANQSRDDEHVGFIIKSDQAKMLVSGLETIFRSVEHF